MPIPFTDREMELAWRENLSAAKKIPCTNAHRLLLFYAVECGLKAVWMKRKGGKRTDLYPDMIECKHNINRLLDSLGAGGNLSLPPEIYIKEIFDTRNNKEERKLNSGDINQIWRYGGKVIAIVQPGKGKIQANDEDIEKKLLAISNWIAGELNKP